MTDFGRVSVVIPVHNGARYLGDAIRSVLAQSLPPFEVIVVDDGSTDDSTAVAGSFEPPVRCVRQPQAGAAAARNRGVAESSGALLAFLDADDLWLPDKLASQQARLAAEPAIDMVFGHVLQFQSPEIAGATGLAAAPQPGLAAGAMLISRDKLLRVGPFDTAFRVGEFIDWHARAVETGLRSDVIPEVVLLRRVHADNLGRRESDSRGDYVRVVKAMLDRRRAAARTGGGS